MESIIKELCFGNICPQESGLANTPELKTLNKSMSEIHEKLEKTLTAEQMKLLENFLDIRDKFEWKYESEIFACGFRLEAKPIMDL